MISQKIETIRKFLLPILVLTMLILFTACDEEPTEFDDYEREPMLSAFIDNGSAVEEVFLERVGEFGKYYSPEIYGILDAEIIMFPLAANPEFESVDPVNTDTLRFIEDLDRNGRYVPVDTNYLPESMVRYRIEVRHPGQDINIWAETTVPDTFTMETYLRSDFENPVDLDGDTLSRASEDMFVTWTESATADGHVLGILALAPESELIPLDPDWDPNDPDDALEEEDYDRYNYTVAPDYQNSIHMTWFYFEWAGPTRLDIKASSKEYYRYIFSLLASNSNDNPEWNVHGGLGIFGATATNSFTIYMEKVEPEE